MKLIKNFGLLAVIIGCLTVSYIFISIINGNNTSPQTEYDKFTSAVEEISDSINFPVEAADLTYLTAIHVENFKLVYEMESAKGARPGEILGQSKEEALDKIKTTIKDTFCAQSYFKKLPIVVEFRFSTKGMRYDPADLVILSAETKKICSH